MNYTSLKNNFFTDGNYTIEPFREKDKLSIKEWRNQQMDVLRQKKVLTDEDQVNYYKNYIEPSFSQKYPGIILFSFLERDICIGYGGLTNIDWENLHVELSFLVNPDRLFNEDLYEEDFSMFIKFMKHVTFDELSFNRIFTETYDIRSHHINTLLQNGFQLEGRMREHIFINNKFADSLIHGFLKKDYNG